MEKQLDFIAELERLKYENTKRYLGPISRTGEDVLGKILAFGVEKYTSYGRHQSLERARLIGIALRYVYQYLFGEDSDWENGIVRLHRASEALKVASEIK